MMKQLFSWAALLAALCGPMYGQAPISPELLTEAEAAAGAYVWTEVVLAAQVDFDALERDFRKRNASLQERTQTVIEALQANAAATQPALIAHLRTLPGVEAGSIEAYWIANALRLRARKEAILAIAQRPEVAYVMNIPPDQLADYEAGECESTEQQAPGGREPGHTAIQAHLLWKLGYSGAGRKVLVIDSGIDGDHPALADNYQGLFSSDAISWYGLNESSSPSDCDPGGHGTHVTGTVCGLNRNTNDTIGVAFNATWMGAPAIDNDSEGQPIAACQGGPGSLQSLQWAINPDGNAATISDMPDVINNSWGSNPNGNTFACTGATVQAINALEAAGVAVVGSAGNRGDQGSATIGAPWISSTSIVNTFSVGAILSTNPSYPLGSFSSQGPSICNGSGALLIKPEVVAPGVNVRSSINGGGYAQFSGTSMASPHVSGALALLKEAFPGLTGDSLKRALYRTALDLGAPGEDNLYGNGLIQVKAAYDYLIAQGNTPATISRANDAAISNVAAGIGRCDTAVAVPITLKNLGTSPLTSVIFDYQYSDGVSGTYTWSGNLAIGASTQVSLPARSLPVGYYTIRVQATLVNGAADTYFIDNLANGTFTILGNDVPVVNQAYVCTGSQALLSGDPGDPTATVQWFSSSAGSTLVGEGNVFLSAPVSQNTVLYAANVYRPHVGKADNIGNGIYSQSIAPYLEFDCKAPIRLRSVKIYTSLPGIRNIRLETEGGAVLNGKIDTLDAGEHRVLLNFDIQPGQKYRLRFSENSTGGVFFNTSNSTSFPYDFGNIIQITNSVVNGSLSASYYFFYDWELEYGSACPRTPVFVVTGPGGANAAFGADRYQVNLAQNATVQFSDSSANAVGWLWNFGDGSTSTQQNPAHAFYVPGIYQVALEVTDASGCTDATTRTVEVTGSYPYPVSVEGELRSPFRVYPNPGKGLFFVQKAEGAPGLYEIEVSDLTGKQCFRQQGAQIGSQPWQLDLSRYPAGFYTLRIRGQEGSFAQRLILE